MKELRIVLDAADFTSLVNGCEVTVRRVNQFGSPEPAAKIILSDIGFDLMAQIIDHARKAHAK